MGHDIVDFKKDTPSLKESVDLKETNTAKDTMKANRLPDERGRTFGTKVGVYNTW